MSIEFDQLMMRRCLDLAKNGIGRVSPNPLVGSVLVKNNQIVSEGFHSNFGGPHAEHMVLLDIPESDLKDFTLYVNLEPCFPFDGKKTPPCSKLIVDKNLGRVVIGSEDPFAGVAGKGIEFLKNSGIKVDVGILKKECQELNKIFYKFHAIGIPYVHLKVAQTLDGKISTQLNHSKWITNDRSRNFVHQLRNQFDCIAVGRGTLNSDNPNLTVRIPEEVKLVQPRRLVIGNINNFDNSSILFMDSNSNKTIVITSEFALKNCKTIDFFRNQHITIITADQLNETTFDWKSILSNLTSLGITSLFLEGGSGIYSSAINQGIVDEMSIFVGAKLFGNGNNWFNNNLIRNVEDSFHFKLKSSQCFDDDIYLNYTKV